jgi:glycosyltransferase involved in cell wall biosynthesis
LHDVTVYSVWHPDVDCHPALKSQTNHYVFIKKDGWRAKLKKRLRRLTHGEGYYHYSIEYYLDEALKDIRRKHFDVIVVENRPGYALRLKGITQARLVYHLHNEKLNRQVPRFQEIYDAADRILTVSDYIRRNVMTINPHDRKTHTLHNGIDLAAFCRKGDASRKGDVSRKDIGLGDEDFVVVFSGRVNPDKGIAQLVEAFALLDAYPHIKLMVVGSSFFGNASTDDPFITALKQKAAPLEERILFTGFIPYARMPAYLQMADVACIPSVWDDPFPTTVLEAQAMGLPIIATRRGGIPEEVGEANAILLEADGQLAARLAAAITDLYEHPEKRKKMSEASLSRSRAFGKDAYARNFFAMLPTAIT